jgi:hypothetical protein
MMLSRLWVFVLAGVAVLVLGGAVVSAAAASTPSGERILGGQGVNAGVIPAGGPTQGSVLEPVYDDVTGAIRYVSTPVGSPDPVNSPPIAAAPFYLPVYPAGASVGTLMCQNVPAENCPDHGGAVAGAAAAIMPNVYAGGVIGHDHLMAGPGSGGDFNVAWVPTLVLFTSPAFVTHITLLSQINALLSAHEVILVPLDGTNGTPNLTFHCSVVSAAVYGNALPWVVPAD